MVLRSRESFSVVPRRLLGSAAGFFAAGAGVDAAAAGAAAGAGASAAFLASSAAASTSCLRIRPPTPVPVTEDRSTECSAASLRTNGVT